MELKNCEEKTDEELVRLTLADKEYYYCLVQCYEEKLGRYIQRISGVGAEDREDILQNVFIKAYSNLNDFDRTLKFSSWIYRIAHNETISHHRREQARPQKEEVEDNDELLNKIRTEFDVAIEVDNQMMRIGIDKVLEQMDKKYREVLVLKFLEDKDYNEISDILRCPVGTVGTLINRAKKKFKDLAQAQGIKFLL